MYFPLKFIDFVRDNIPLEEIVSNEGITLRKSGRYFKGLCPFYDEKTPSLKVVIDKQIWICFGCRRGGDCFDFIQMRRGINFPLAVKYLATRYGIPLPIGYNKKRGDFRENEDHLTYNSDTVYLVSRVEMDTIIF